MKFVLFTLLFYFEFTAITLGQQSKFPLYDAKNVIYLSPKENKVVYNRDIQLSWLDTGNNKNFNLQISMDKNFCNLILDTIVDDVFFTIRTLGKHKEYFWRILDYQNDDCYNYQNTAYSFFKTTSMQMQEPMQYYNKVVLIPAWIEEKEVIFIDNPDQVSYDVKVISQAEKCKKFSCKTSKEKQGILIYDWPRGRYIVELKIGDLPEQITEIYLTQN